MARKRKTSAADDIVELVALLPWWAGIALAIIFYYVLHSLASKEVAMTLANPGQAGRLMVDILEQNLAAVGQYVLPLFCLIGTVVSITRRRTRAQLVKDVVSDTGSRTLKEMSWQEFEQLTGEAFRLQGFRVQENGGGGADGGVDLVLEKQGEKFLVQCKQWRALKVGVQIVRELYGVMAASGAAGGFVVTCGRFTDEAMTFAKGRNVVLVDGNELEKMIQQTRRGSNVTPGNARPNLATSVPECPVCGKTMLLRTAQRGANAGNKFWGCSAYPSCKGIVSTT